MADPIDYDKLATANAAAISKIMNSNRRTPVPESSGAFSSPAELAASLATVTGSATNAVKGMVGLVNDTVNVWQQASNLGIGFSNDAVGLRSAIGVTRLGVSEYFEVIQRTQLGFTSLGGSMSDSTKAFSRLSQAFSDAKYSDELRAIGFTTKEFNEVLALSINGQRIRNIEDPKVQAAVATSARELALEMDKVAQLTGISRKEQMDALQESQRNARVQATLQDMLANGGKNLKDSYDQMKVGLTGLGLGKLGDELFTGQAKTRETINQLNALGPAGTQLQAAITAVREATTEPQKEAARIMLEQAKMSVSARTQEQSFRALVRYGEGEVADAARGISISTRNFSEAIKSVQDEYKEKTGKVLTDTEAKDLATKRLELRQQGLELDLVTGKTRAIAGAKTTELAVQTAARINDAGVILYESLNAVNELIGKSDLVKKGLEATANIKVGEDGVARSFAQRFGGTALQSLPREIEAGTAVQNIPKLLTTAATELTELLKTSGVDFGSAVVDSAKHFGEELWNGIKDWWTNIGGNKRHTGTLGMTGKLFEEKDFFGQVAKGETVLTPQQLENLVRGVQDSSKPTIPAEFTSLLQGIQVELSKPASENTNIDLFSNMFRDIQTTISSVNAPSKNPVSDIVSIMSDQLRKVETSISAGFGDISNKEEPTEEPNFANLSDVFSGFFKELQSENTKIVDGVRSSVDLLSTVIPANQPQTQTSELSRIIPNEIKQARAEEQRQEQNRRQQEILNMAPEEKRPDSKADFGPMSTALDDMKELLVQLNSTMGSTASQLSSLVDATEKQVRATKRMDPNVAIR